MELLEKEMQGFKTRLNQLKGSTMNISDTRKSTVMFRASKAMVEVKEQTDTSAPENGSSILTTYGKSPARKRQLTKYWNDFFDVWQVVVVLMIIAQSIQN